MARETARRIPPDWIFDEEMVKKSPSRIAGMTQDQEMTHLRQGISLIIDLGTLMKLKMNPTNAAACVFFQRFYMMHSIQEFPVYATACSCLFLAGKSEETPKKCRDVANAALSSKFSSILPPRANLTNIMEDIMGMERVILQTIKFDFTVDLPYNYIIKYANNFKKQYDVNAARGVQHSLTREQYKDMVSELVRTAWTLVNDSFYTYLPLMWETQIIAVSLFWLAIKFKQEDQLNESRWWEDHVAELSSEKMESICHMVLDYYSSANPTAAQQT